MSRLDVTPATDVFPVLTLPAAGATAWVVETTQEEAAAWLAKLPRADVPQTAQLLYQALFTLNRMALDVDDRLRLLELYRPLLASVSAELWSRLPAVSLPLRPRHKQLADFIIQLQVEMAFGYKHVLLAARAEPRPWENDAVLLAVARAIDALGNVLLNHYQVYLPTPEGIWREIHGLYRYAEAHGCQGRALAALNQNEPLSVQHSYLRALMLGVCNPYQLPQNECHRVHAFLGAWAHRVAISTDIDGVDPLGQFLLDLDADHPATPFPQDVSLHTQASWRRINAIELAREVHGFVTRLQKGEMPGSRVLGFECRDATCIEVLKRMLRFWGLAARRQFARRTQRRSLALCIGLPAVHFFVNGQQPFPGLRPTNAPASRALALPSQSELEAEARDDASVISPTTLTYRADNRWQVRDESASGLLLARSGDLGSSVRVGDLAGIQGPGQVHWRLGVVRWVKSPGTQQVEMGVEMLAPAAQALAMRPVGLATAAYEPVLLLPAIQTLRRPATLLAGRGTLRVGETLELVDGQSAPRRVRVLNIAERSPNFVQAVFADAAH